jgi:hypothetical protein
MIVNPLGLSAITRTTARAVLSNESGVCFKPAINPDAVSANNLIRRMAKLLRCKRIS